MYVWWSTFRGPGGQGGRASPRRKWASPLALGQAEGGRSRDERGRWEAGAGMMKQGLGRPVLPLEPAFRPPAHHPRGWAQASLEPWERETRWGGGGGSQECPTGPAGLPGPGILAEKSAGDRRGCSWDRLGQPEDAGEGGSFEPCGPRPPHPTPSPQTSLGSVLPRTSDQERDSPSQPSPSGPGVLASGFTCGDPRSPYLNLSSPSVTRKLVRTQVLRFRRPPPPASLCSLCPSLILGSESPTICSPEGERPGPGSGAGWEGRPV